MPSPEYGWNPKKGNSELGGEGDGGWGERDTHIQRLIKVIKSLNLSGADNQD